MELGSAPPCQLFDRLVTLKACWKMIEQYDDCLSKDDVAKITDNVQQKRTPLAKLVAAANSAQKLLAEKIKKHKKSAEDSKPQQPPRKKARAPEIYLFEGAMLESREIPTVRQYEDLDRFTLYGTLHT